MCWHLDPLALPLCCVIKFLEARDSFIVPQALGTMSQTAGMLFDEKMIPKYDSYPCQANRGGMAQETLTCV